jgi:hypothetical protein
LTAVFHPFPQHLSCQFPFFLSAGAYSAPSSTAVQLI